MAKQVIERFGVQAPLYSVILRRKDGSEFTSCASEGPAFLSYERVRADQHLAMCKEQGFRGRVARVSVTVETRTTTKKKR